jgi:GTPase SAR1 family protein
MDQHEILQKIENCRINGQTSIDLSGLGLKFLPPEIGALKSLEYLNLAGNQLKSLPKEFVNLQNLIFLNLGGNAFTSLPAEILKLNNLTTLYMYNNLLSSIDSRICELVKLKTLTLYVNNIVSLPSGIGKLSNLRKLSLNQNHISSLPSEIVQLHDDLDIKLDENPLEKPPLEICSKGINAIKQYFSQIEEEGEAKLYEAKLLLIGEGESGKTTLAEKLKNPEWQLRLTGSTEGIDIHVWKFPLNNNEEFRANIWDFGGQQIYHYTHQYFLTSRSLYALVVDNRKEHCDVDYWLNIVELLGSGSPLILVKNYKKNIEVKINESDIRKRFANVKDIIPVNFSDNSGLNNLIDSIKYNINKLELVGARLPKTWVKVREELERDCRYYISQEEYINICIKNNIVRKRDILQLSGYFHDLGIFLHFQDNKILKRRIILKPEWATDAAFSVLDNDNINRSYGKFNEQDLLKIWDSEKYKDMTDELLELMLKFKLCYKIKNSDYYVAPQLLPSNQPTYSWDYRNNLFIRYKYEFMPKGIVTRLIVELNDLIENQYLVWNEGVLFLKDETRAEVIEKYIQKEIHLKFVGVYKRDLFAIVTREIDAINSSFKNIKVDKLVPCYCKECVNSVEPYFFSYNNLSKLYMKNVELVTCQYSGQLVPLPELLEGIKININDTPSIFISYAQNDQKTFKSGNWFNRISTHLKPLLKSKEIKIFSDKDINAGEKWEKKIDEALKDCNIGILLVSADFFASDFIMEKELPYLLQKEDKCKIKIFTVICSPTVLDLRLNKIQAINDPKDDLLNSDDGKRENVYKKLRTEIETYIKSKSIL